MEDPIKVFFSIILSILPLFLVLPICHFYSKVRNINIAKKVLFVTALIFCTISPMAIAYTMSTAMWNFMIYMFLFYISFFICFFVMAKIPKEKRKKYKLWIIPIFYISIFVICIINTNTVLFEIGSENQRYEYVRQDQINSEANTFTIQCNVYSKTCTVYIVKDKSILRIDDVKNIEEYDTSKKVWLKKTKTLMVSEISQIFSKPTKVNWQKEEYELMFS